MTLKLEDQLRGAIRPNKSVTRFWHRGKEKVNLVWTLHCLVHNLGKLVVNAPGYLRETGRRERRESLKRRGKALKNGFSAQIERLHTPATTGAAAQHR